MKPFVKWAGGKRQILDRIKAYIAETIGNKEDIVGNDDYTYIEPFLGGGAVFFSLHHKKAIINDLNSDLMNAYEVIKSNQYELLIDLLREHAQHYYEDPDGYYYEVRAWDRAEDWPNNYNAVERAARMIFLNRTCYNGLYRVNNRGQFNTPIGRYKNPLICDVKNITEIHNYLSSPKNDITIMHKSYEYAIRLAKDGDIIYIDPPYDYEDDDGFTKYQMNGFTFEDFKKLKEECDKALDRGAFVIISNNATEKVIHLFEEDPKYVIYYDINKFSTLRTINCHGNERKTGCEVIIWGMNNNVPFPQANDMNKIIKLLQCDENILNNKEEIQNVINVGSVRQVAYYLSALQFLHYLTHQKTFTESAKALNKDEIKIKKDIYNRLMSNELFSIFYNRFELFKIVNLDDIKTHLKEKFKDKLSVATIERRSNTIKAWVEWMYSYDDEKNQ